MLLRTQDQNGVGAPLSEMVQRLRSRWIRHGCPAQQDSPAPATALSSPIARAIASSPGEVGSAVERPTISTGDEELETTGLLHDSRKSLGWGIRHAAPFELENGGLAHHWTSSSMWCMRQLP